MKYLVQWSIALRMKNIICTLACLVLLSSPASADQLDKQIVCAAEGTSKVERIWILTQFIGNDEATDEDRKALLEIANSNFGGCGLTKEEFSAFPEWKKEGVLISYTLELLSPDASLPNSSTPATDASLPMTLGEQDALRQQVLKCWSPPIGAAEAENLLVTLKINLNQDGTLIGYPKIVDSSSMKSGVRRVAEESAVRAVIQCQPYILPLEKYQSWRVVTMNFDPKDMFR